MRLPLLTVPYYLRYKVPKTLYTDVKTEVKTEILPYVKTEVQVAMYLSPREFSIVPRYPSGVLVGKAGW